MSITCYHCRYQVSIPNPGRIWPCSPSPNDAYSWELQPVIIFPSEAVSNHIAFLKTLKAEACADGRERITELA